MLSNLSGRVALLIGVASGIGAATAELLGASGMSVLCADNDYVLLRRHRGVRLVLGYPARVRGRLFHQQGCGRGHAGPAAIACRDR